MTYVAKRTEGGPVLAFTFHGTGGDETQFHGFAEQLLPGASVVSPRGDVSEMGARRYFRRTGEGVYDMDDLARRTEAMAAFLSEERARAGATRTVGLGYSNGANILAAVAFLHPGIVDDLILMHPLIPWQPAPQPGLAGRRVLVTAGRTDPICPAPLTRRLIDWFGALGAEVAEHWHPGGHEIAPGEVEAIRAFTATIAA
jgi:phospholipase/carboxylesterase